MSSTLTETAFTLKDFIADPPEEKEWIDGSLVEKTGMTIRRSKLQSVISWLWRNYLLESGQGGEVYVELPCLTLDRGRRPDVSYLTTELVDKFGDRDTLPQSPSLIAEIASLSDAAEDLFAKTDEYLASGCREVWLVFPESHRLLIVTQTQTWAFHNPDEVRTQEVLSGFRVSLGDLFN